MARNKIQTNKAIFDRLKNWAVSTLGGPLPASVMESGYYVATTKTGQEWLVDADVSKETIVFQSSIALSFCLGDDIVYCLVGFPGLELDNEHFLDIETADGKESPVCGLVTLTVFELALSPIESVHQLLNVVLIDEGRVQKKVAVPVEAIRSIFPSMRFFRIRPESPLGTASPLHKVVSWVVMGNMNTLSTLDYQEASVDEIQDALVNAPLQFPYHCVYRALTATRWEYAYLEIYRSIERLFALPDAVAFNGKIGSNMSPLSVIRELENTLGWRPKEEAALTRIFEGLSEDLLKSMAGALPNCHVPDGGSKGGTVGRAVYKLRNAIVHYRPAIDAPSYESGMWNQLIKGLVRASAEAYGAYSRHLD